MKGNSPWKEKHGFNVEGDKDKGVKKVLDLKLNPGNTLSINAALVGCFFFGGVFMGAEDKA